MTSTKHGPAKKTVRELAEEILSKESAAIGELKGQLNWTNLTAAIGMLLDCEGLILVTGSGTSSSIARRMAHVLTCSGRPSVFLDPAQARHGYSALIQPADVIVAFSRGGETDEVNHVLSVARNVGAQSIAVSEARNSSMADLSSLLLQANISAANDVGGVIPLASTLAHAAVADILCAAVLEEHGMPERDFAEHHPGGAVGKRLSRQSGEVHEERKFVEAKHADLGDIGGLILDMDGVLWHGDQLLPGVEAFFAYLQEKDLRFVLATNNPSKRASEFAEKAKSFGLPVEADDIVSSSVATVHYLKRTYPEGTRIHVIGEQALKSQVAEAGFVLADEDVAAVVAALQRDLTYETIKRGTLLIRAGAQFIGTNADPSYPTEEGFVPGSGMMVTALAASSDQEPLVMGKPQRGIFDLALDKLDMPIDRVASVGDRLDTDILGGARYGLRTVLLLTGIAQREDIAASEVQPDWVFENLPELLVALESAHKK